MAAPAATAVTSKPVQNTLGAELAGPARRPVDAKLLAKLKTLSDKLRDAELPAGKTLRTHGYTLSEDGEISGEFQPILSDHDRTHGHGTSNDPTNLSNWAGQSLDARIGTNSASLSSQTTGMGYAASLPLPQGSCGNTPCPDPLVSQTVKWVDPNGHVIEAFFNRGDNGWSSDDLTIATSAPTAKGPLVVFQTAQNLQQHVMYIGTDNGIHELFFDGTHWHHSDLTALTGAARVAGNARALTGYQTTPDNKERVDFVAATGDILELSFDTSWHLVNVTQNAHQTDSSTPEAQTNSALTGYQTTYNSQQHIDYISAGGDLCELFVGTDGHWHSNDLTLAAQKVDPNVPFPQTGTSLAAYVTTFNGFNQQHVDFIGEGGDGTPGSIFEVMIDSSVHPRNLTADGSAPVPDPASQLAAFATTYNGQQHVDFIDFAGHVRELLFPSGGTHWLSNDLFSLTSNLPAGTLAGTAALDGYQITSPNIVTPSQQHVSFVSKNDSHVHDMFINVGDNTWTDTDLTANAHIPWVTAVGTWTVPTISEPIQPAGAVPFNVAALTDGWVGSTWVGIDGDGGSTTKTGDVLQAGTQEALLDDDPSQKNTAWFEWYTPDSDLLDILIDFPYIREQNIDNLPANAGDVFFTSISHAGSTGFIVLTNVTKGLMATVTLAPPPQSNFQGGSAEWIMETPTVNHLIGDDELAILPDFTPVKFTQATTTDANGNVNDPSNTGGTQADPKTIVRKDFFGNDVNLTNTINSLDQCEIDRVDWYDADLSKLTGAPAAAGRLVGFQTTFTTPPQEHVVYIGTDRHVHELVFPINNKWVHNDLTQQLGATLPAVGSALTGYQTTYDSQQHIDYVSADGHIREFWFDTSWHAHDIWADAHQVNGSTPLAVVTSSLTGFQTTFNSQQHVNYISSDGHVRELWFDKTVSNLWQPHDPWSDAHSANTSEPVALQATALAGYQTTWDKQVHVDFISSNSHVNELWYDTAWHWNDLTNAAKAPTTQQSSAIGSFPSASNSQQHVTFVGAGGQVFELVYNKPNWTFNNLSVKAGITGVVASTSALVGYQQVFNNQYRVDFISTPDNHVRELNFDGKNWIGRDLTNVPSGPGSEFAQATAANSKLASFETSLVLPFGMVDDQNHVNYIGGDNDVHELLHGP